MANILVVDDDPSILEFLRAALVREGHEELTAFNGEEGILAIQKNDFDLIITDQMMPRLDGNELLRWIRRNCSDVPVIMISGVVNEPDVFEADGSKIKPDYFFTKPFDIPEFLRAVHKLLDKAGSSRFTKVVSE